MAPYAAYWAALEALGDDPLLYVALGDSAGQGVGATHPSKGYVGILAERLAEATGRPVRTLNLSRSGAKTLHVLRDQVPRLDGLVPDLLTVSAGANDIIRLVRRRTLEERLRRLAAALPPGTVLADIPCFGGGSFERKARWASALVAELCEEHGLVRAPLHEFTERDLSRTLYAEDWLHPSDAGYAVWADAMWQAAERARTL